MSVMGRLKSALRPLLLAPPPAPLAARFRRLDEAGRAHVEDALRRSYFPDSREDLTTPAGRAVFADHVEGRLAAFRAGVIPWLDAARPLGGGARILEIGCGTGSSTAALAEQGALVTGIDVLESSLAVARARLEALGLSARLECLNATQAASALAGERFDWIIFFATLEHMTHAERMDAMTSTWEMLPPGGLWCLVETPNRLWYHDYHTSQLPFYQWLPDDLALRYARFSPRQSFSGVHRESLDDLSKTGFLRLGRGVSYHEFDLTLGPAAGLEVVSSLAAFTRRRSPLAGLVWSFTREARYARFLAQVGPRLHPAFYEKSLDLVIRKPRA